MRVWKYRLTKAPDAQPIMMPGKAEILCVQLQDGEITLWAKVDPTIPAALRHFVVLWTGEAFLDQTTYVGTVQESGIAGLVYHVFEIEEERE